MENILHLLITTVKLPCNYSSLFIKKGFGTFAQETQEDGLVTFDEKTEKEQKAIEDLCALSEEETNRSFENNFDKLWSPFMKPKKRKNKL